MGLFDSLERLITEHGSAAIMKERLELIKDKYEELSEKLIAATAEKESLNARLIDLTARNEFLENEIERLKATMSGSSLSNKANEILNKAFDMPRGISPEQISRVFGLSNGETDFYLDELKEQKFMRQSGVAVIGGLGGDVPARYSITTEGRRHVMQNRLLYDSHKTSFNALFRSSAL